MQARSVSLLPGLHSLVEAPRALQVSPVQPSQHRLHCRRAWLPPPSPLVPSPQELLQPYLAPLNSPLSPLSHPPPQLLRLSRQPLRYRFRKSGSPPDKSCPPSFRQCPVFPSAAPASCPQASRRN